MKKVISMILAIAMFSALLAACGAAKPAETTAPAAQAEAADGKTYSSTVKGTDIKMTLNDDNTEVSIEVMGMVMEAAVEVSDNILTMKGKISGNDQLWSRFAGLQFTLNDDGTAVVNE